MIFVLVLLCIIINCVIMPTFCRNDEYMEFGGRYCKNECQFSVRILQDNIQICSGVVTSKNWLLSAGHCFDKYEPNFTSFSLDEENPFKIVVGWSKINQTLPITNVYRPVNYQNNLIDGVGKATADIAVIKLASPITSPDILSAITNPVILANHDTDTSSSSLRDKILTVVGFGMISHGDFPKRAKKMNVTLGSANEIDESTFNGWVELGRGYTCEGDSGSPLIYFDSESVPIVVGILSSGQIGKCDPKNRLNRYNLYTNVSYYAEFIENTISDNSRYDNTASINLKSELITFAICTTAFYLL